jgi:hypothetical protein
LAEYRENYNHGGSAVATYHACIVTIEAVSLWKQRRFCAAIEEGNCVTSILSLGAPVNSSGFAIVGFDLRREYPAKPWVTYRWDASAAREPGETPADQLHRAVATTSGVYADVFETADWIEQSSPRKLGIGKYAGD